MISYYKFKDSKCSIYDSSANSLPSISKMDIFSWNAKGLISLILLNEQ